MTIADSVIERAPEVVDPDTTGCINEWQAMGVSISAPCIVTCCDERAACSHGGMAAARGRDTGRKIRSVIYLPCDVSLVRCHSAVSVRDGTRLS